MSADMTGEAVLAVGDAICESIWVFVDGDASFGVDAAGLMGDIDRALASEGFIVARVAELERLRSIVRDAAPFVAMIGTKANDRVADDEIIWDRVNPTGAQARAAHQLMYQTAAYDGHPVNEHGCRYDCFGYFMGEAFVHEPGCPWLRATREQEV